MLALLFSLLQFTVHIKPFGYQNAPVTIEVVVTVDPDVDTRGLAVEVLSDEYDSTSQRDIDVHSARVQRFTFRNLREGNYQAHATLIQWKDGKWKLTAIKAPELLEVH